MAFTDTEIHRIELLITLDYLLRFTDENHPATQIDICEHAREFGLKYDKNATEGNDVRRQRIGDCLKYLKTLTNKYGESFPFVLERTESGKYYIEQKNYLTDDQIVEILAAVKSDKYAREKDTNYLLDRLLDAFTNVYNRNKLMLEADEIVRGKKVNDTTSKKYRLVLKAYKEKKSILIVQSHFGRLTADDLPDMFHEAGGNKRIFIGTSEHKVFCRVYKIQDFNNKPYAILIPINKPGIIFDAAENLSIPTSLPLRELMMEDETDDNRLNELFEMNNARLSQYYGSLDNYIGQQIVPEKGFSFKTSFYFEYRYLDRVRNSYEEFFSQTMPVIKCNSFNVKEDKLNTGFALEQPHKNDEFAIKCNQVEDENPKYGVVNVTINKNAFISWLYNNPNIADVIEVVAPKSINENLAHYFLGMLMKYSDYISEEMVNKAITATKSFKRKK